MSNTVAVIGSRNFIDYNYLKETLHDFDIYKIISGGARGADTLAARYAYEHNIHFEEILPNYEKFSGHQAPLERNKEVVNKSDFVIAFWDGVSKGTIYKGFRIQKTYGILFPDGSAYDYCFSMEEAKEKINMLKKSGAGKNV